MAIRIGGTSIIDDNKNISNVGVVTIGTGGTTGRVQVGTGTTIFGSGNVAIAGTLSALDISVPLKIDGFSPSHLATNVATDTNIEIYFNKAVGVGTTGFVEIRNNSGTALQRFNVGAATTQISFTGASRVLTINPTSNLPKSSPGVASTIFVVVTSDFINDPNFKGINVSGSVGVGTTYKFSTEAVLLGQSYEGGYLICVASGIQWIVSPIAAEVSRSWYLRNDANTRAQQVSGGCSGWFVPSMAQYQNPGYACRSFWDSYSSMQYWSSEDCQGGPNGCWLSMGNAQTNPNNKNSIYCVRSFRCVTY